MQQQTMSYKKIIRAWKDANFRDTLSEEQCALLPEHPAGTVELTDAQLGKAAGGKNIPSSYRYGDCNSGIIACTLPINCPVEQ
jgi:mersacidin/lichenicidin family type 2 lantibiotic